MNENLLVSGLGALGETEVLCTLIGILQNLVLRFLRIPTCYLPLGKGSISSLLCPLFLSFLERPQGR